MPAAQAELTVKRLGEMFAAYNPRRIEPHRFDALKGSMRDFGLMQEVVCNRRSRKRGWAAPSKPCVVGGHQRIRAAKEIGLAKLRVHWIDVTERNEMRANLLLNNTEGEFVPDMLAAVFLQMRELGDPLDELGFGPGEVDAFLAGTDGSITTKRTEAGRILRERFLIPPFSVLDARQGYWRDRKSAWLLLGIVSELGRAAVIPGSTVKGAREDLSSAPPRAAGLYTLGHKPKSGVFDGIVPPMGDATVKAAKKRGRAEATTPRKQAPIEGPLLMKSDSGRDPAYYAQKRAVEKKLGHKITTADFQKDHYVPPEGTSGLSTSGTSVFDPVLSEIVYRWFCPPAGTVLDPFAGGSVRGVVAAALGRRYSGVELRAEQIEANYAQAKDILPRKTGKKSKAKKAAAPTREREIVTDSDALTPVQKVGKVWIKRDDLFDYNGATGSKARSIIALLDGATGATTAGNRHSPMAARVARVAEKLGLPSRAHMAGSRKLSPEERDAEAHGCTLVKHKVNFLKALLSKARVDAEERGWVFVPLAAESGLYVDQTRKQVANLPPKAKRLVVPVGSGMALAAILHGLDDVGRGDLPVVGVSIGMDPVPTLDKWAPENWRDRVEMVAGAGKFEEVAPITTWWGVELDPHYEAKAAPFVEDGDVFWCVAISATLSSSTAPGNRPEVDDIQLEGAPLPEYFLGDSAEMAKIKALPKAGFDLVFSCPPYYDLERYSGDDRDLSNAPTYKEFLDGYEKVIRGAADRLSDDRFFVLVVGEVRSGTYTGGYHGLVPDTIRLCREAGLDYYNEAILVTPGGSLPVRVGRQFDTSRKIGKTHQNVLVFVKGDWRKATEAIGPVQYGKTDGNEEAVEQAEAEARAASA